MHVGSVAGTVHEMQNFVSSPWSIPGGHVGKPPLLADSGEVAGGAGGAVAPPAGLKKGAPK